MASSSSSSATNQASGGGGDGDGNAQQPPNPDQSTKMPFPTEMLPRVCRFMPVEELWKLADVSSEWRAIVLPFIMERSMSMGGDEGGAAGGGS